MAQQLPNSSNDDSWTNHSFRQSVVAKIEEVIQKSGMNTSRNSVEMENHVFMKAKTREEYLGFVARLILHVREMRAPNNAAPNPLMNQMNPQQGGMMVNQMPMQNQMNSQIQNNLQQPMQQRGLPMAMNQQFAGPRGQTSNYMNQNQPPSGQSPTVNLGVPQGMNQMMNSSNLGQSSGMMSSQSQKPMNMNPNPNTIPNPNVAMNGTNQQMLANANIANSQSSKYIEPLQKMIARIENNGPNNNQIPNQLLNQMNQMNQMNPQQGGMMLNQMPMQNQMNPQIQSNMQAMQHRGHPMAMNQQFAGPRGQTSTYMNQNVSPSIPSPTIGPGSSQGMNQMIPSPALIPSPGMMSNQSQKSMGMSPSPSGPLNTPGQPFMSTTSPSNAQEDQLYRDKVRQLSKYIEPLQKMIARLENNDLEKMSKMKKLLEILQNPNQRMPLETLCKCEMVLEKLDFKRTDSSFIPTAFKDNHMFNSLLEVIHNNIQNANFNHSLQRTFAPTMNMLFGSEFKLPPLSSQKPEVVDSNSNNEVSDILQGEIARLDQRFKISLDTTQVPGTRSVQLSCHLDDHHLPCVPPISLLIPDNYPDSSPKCNDFSHEYNATSFLISIKDALSYRIDKLPTNFTVSQLLNSWEMSVRQACSPDFTANLEASIFFGF